MIEQPVSRKQKRKYELKRRAEKQAETRLRIIEATVKFHSTIGPARTTVAKICREAQVQRATFYRHFPDALMLFEECRAFVMHESPLPDIANFAKIADPVRRLRAALTTVYSYFRQHEQRMAAIIRDADVLPGSGGGFFRYQDRLSEVLAGAWQARGRRHARILAACGHAVDFQAWRSLASRQGLNDRAVIDSMVTLVRGAAGQIG
jgi:AcrR family transcriptional regulator